MKRALILFLFLIIPNFVLAQKVELTPDEQNRANALYDQVRCPTCVSQSVKESETPASKQIRQYIDAQVKKGTSDEEILTNLRAYFGDTILYEPAFNWKTALIWILPLVFIVLAVVYCWREDPY